MRLRKLIATLLLIRFSSSTALAGNLPYIPVAAAPLAATMSTVEGSASVTLSSRMGTSPANFRGNFGENVMRSYFTGGLDLSSNKRWYSIDPGAIFVKRGGEMILLDPSKTGRAGFDGLFMQFNSKGSPTSVMVAESKFADSQLGQTKYTGKQMSDEWIRPRAARAAQHYKRMSSLVEGGRVRQSSTLPNSGKITQVPLSNKESVSIWWDKDTNGYVYYSEKPVSVKAIQRGLNNVTQMMDKVAKGEVTPRRVLWHIDAQKGNITVTRSSLDANGNVIGKPQRINILSKSYAQLSPKNQALFDDAVINSLSKQRYKGIPDEIAREAAKRDWETAKRQGRAEEFIKNYNPSDTRFPWREVGKISLKAGLIGGGFALVFSLIPRLRSSIFDGKDFDYMGFIRDVGLGFTSAFAGAMTGLGTNYLLSTSQSMLAKMIPQRLHSIFSGTVSGLLASAIFAYGYAMLTGGSLKDANRLMITGVGATAAGALASYAILQTAMLVGTASTGTAISSLSGIVATKAAMAWLGGGTVAAGGWGMAGGAVVLSGGALIAVFAVTAVFSYGWNLLEEGERLEHLQALVRAYPRY